MVRVNADPERLPVAWIGETPESPWLKASHVNEPGEIGAGENSNSSAGVSAKKPNLPLHVSNLPPSPQQHSSRLPFVCSGSRIAVFCGEHPPFHCCLVFQVPNAACYDV